MLASGTASRPMKTWGLRTLSQRVSRARRRDSRRARSAASLKQSRRNRPPGRKISSAEPSGVAIIRGPSRKDGTLWLDYDEPRRTTQGAVWATRPLAVAPIAAIVTSVSTFDDRYGSEPGVGGLACGTWDNGESAPCAALWSAVEFA